jgi:hypothetical protein
VCFSRRKPDIFAAIEAETVSHDCGPCLEYPNYFKLRIAVIAGRKDREIVGAIFEEERRTVFVLMNDPEWDDVCSSKRTCSYDQIISAGSRGERKLSA